MSSSPGSLDGLSRSAWHAACWTRRLRRRPLARTLLGQPVVLFRDHEGIARALVDRCPHRNAPLSLGRVSAEGLRCGYHGWTFDGMGRCSSIPGLPGPAEGRGRSATALRTRERDGVVWCWTDPETDPVGEPFELPSDPRFTTLRYEMTLDASLHAAVENILDVPHTAFLHGGLFRTDRSRSAVTVNVRRGPDRVEAEFLGEPRPRGLLGRLLAPGGGIVTHFDRFVLPSVAQVEYAIGDDLQLVTTNLLTPVSERRTRMFAVVRFRSRFPGWVVATLLGPLARIVLEQDRSMLRHQSRCIERFGGERYSSTEIDVLGADVAQLLRQAAEGRAPEDERERTVTLMA